MGAAPDLPNVEKLVEAVARKFFLRRTDFEDLAEAARIAVWKLLEKNAVAVKSFCPYKTSIWKSVESAIWREFEKSREDGLTAGDEINLRRILSCYRKKGLNFIFKENRARAFLGSVGRRSLREKSAESKRRVMSLLIHIMGIGKNDIPRKISYRIFLDYGLGHWLWKFFGNSPFRAIDFAYPGKFLPYQMAQTSMRYWSEAGGRERAIAALRKILQETGRAENDYPKLLSDSFFEKSKLYRPLRKIFEGDRFAYLDAAFPGRFRPWEFSVTPAGFFDSPDNVKKAVRWLLEEKLGYPMPHLSAGEIWDKGVSRKVTKKVFNAYGLRAITATYGSAEAALRLTYPGKFLPWSFCRKAKWSGGEGRELAALATRWLIEEHVRISPVSPEINCDFFRRNGLWGMLTAKSLGFNTSPRAALRNAYPEPAQARP